MPGGYITPGIPTAAAASVQSGALPAASITSGLVASGVLGNVHLASGGLTGSGVASGALGNFHLVSGGLQSGALGSGTVTLWTLGSGALIAQSGILAAFNSSGQLVIGRNA